MGMFYNGVNCDFYIGKGAGKKLLNDIRNAKDSVKIVSPYLSPFLITELIKLKQRKISVALITTDNIEDYKGQYEKNIHKLIIQNRETDKASVEKREKWKRIVRILIYCFIVLFVILGATAYLLRDIKIVYGLIPLTITIVVIRILNNMVRKKRIYSYWYSQLFPFKVYMSPNTNNQSDTFIHSKIYLIDNEIAYLGSLNFTSSGTKFNYETRIRTIDTAAIKEISKEIYQLMNHSDLPERDIQIWGKQLYHEPIN
jgi:phosphatidylserine/phosphatidylglycerophosphate/cardiolipin synthase-like enzyme